MASEESVASSAQALVSLKEGLGSPQRIGHYPSRIRKKNARFFNDDEETDYQVSRTPKRRAVQPPAPAPVRPAPVSAGLDKRAAQATGMRLRNLLKLPKAHKWVCYEWFYSNIDAPLFLGENDFCICLRESFPQLKCKKLRRVEWNKIRRLMGKPRRCSPAFLAEERAVLEERREKIRQLQQRKTTEFNSIKELPNEIPLHLVIGTKVTARLRKPQDGLFTGTIAALDTADNSYRVDFDRPGLGTHSIPDYEVLSDEPPDSISISAFQEKPKRQPIKQINTVPKFVPGVVTGSNASFTSGGDVCIRPFKSLGFEGMETHSPFKGKLVSLEGGTYGGFPIKFLVLVTRLSKILQVKKEWIKQLSDMNTTTEKKRSFQEPISLAFQKTYAGIVVELEKLNKDLNEYLNGVQTYCQDISPDQGVTPAEPPSEIKRKCDTEAEETVARICRGMLQNRRTANNERVLKLVSDLTSIMLQIRTFSENENSSFEFGSLQDSLQAIKGGLDANNLNVFQNNVEIHINHIQSGLSQMGNLHAFAASSSSTGV
ncbi:protein lin-9 homolog [Aplysia californica]|uniref:Protein lin-9 homolog n=1 Tax=Aplysia californica TaxID=6500 RepID=A0ABM1A9H7_APLCA|nr:protein lin-9 homolog [Aplysia californica]XP_012943395.1 protein lin-9 homolog [Aplysia californica]XP_035828245.1 protein lin-9 homolog [Aplysia californica]